MGCGKSKHDVASGNTVLKPKKSIIKRNKDQEIGAQTKEDDNSNVNNLNVNSGVEVQKDGGDNVVKEVVRGKVDDVDSNAVKSKTDNASILEETLLQKNNVIVVAGENNADVGKEKVIEKSEEVVSGGDKVERSNGENANEGEEKVVEKREEVGVVADKSESKTEKTDVEEEKKDKQVNGEEELVLKEVSEKSQGFEEDDALKLNENDQKVNDAPVVVEENKNGDGKDDVSVKEEIVAKEEAPKDIINVAASEDEKKDLKSEEEQKEDHLSNEDVKAN